MSTAWVAWVVWLGAVGVGGGCSSAARPAMVSATQARVAVHDVVAVEEIGDATIVLDAGHAYVLRGGAIASVIEAPHGFRGGGTIAAPDGDGRWAVGFDREGQLWRITIGGELEAVSDRFKLANARIDGIAGAGAVSAFALADGLAVSDGIHLQRTMTLAPVGVAASRERVAVLRPHAVDAWDVPRGLVSSYPLTARAIAFVDGKLAVATDQVLYLEAGGALRQIAVPAPVTALIASGSRLWIVAGDLYALDGARLHRADVKLPASARLFGSPTGDAWIASSTGLVRASIDRVVSDPVWEAHVAPVFQRVCSHCHLPGGSAGIDLSHAAAWNTERAELTRRVLVTRTMPPAGVELSDDDRQTLATWLGVR